MFRDAAAYVDRYFNQIATLRTGLDLRLVVAEGDSSDGTLDLVKNRLVSDDRLVKVDHGGPRFGSVDVAERWEQIATVARAVLAEVSGAVLWVEADLVWDADTLHALVLDLNRVDAVAPMVMASDGQRFYDVWGFRRDGERFMPNPPYYFSPDPEPDGLVKIDSCGSCWAALQPCWTGWHGRWPFTANGNLWLDPQLSLRHP